MSHASNVSRDAHVHPMSGAMRAHSSGGGGAAASGGGSSSAAAVGGREEVDMRLHAIVHRLDCTSDVGWGRIIGYATAEERSSHIRCDFLDGENSRDDGDVTRDRESAS